MERTTKATIAVASVALVAFCATLAYGAIKMPDLQNEKADAAGVQSLVAANCRPENPTSRLYDLVGIDTKLAGGIIVSHPEQLGHVCNIVNNSLIKVSLREFTRSDSYKDMGHERADNTHLERLAQSLDLSSQEASQLVRAHGQDILRHGHKPTVHAVDKDSTRHPMDL